MLADLVIDFCGIAARHGAGCVGVEIQEFKGSELVWEFMTFNFPDIAERHSALARYLYSSSTILLPSITQTNCWLVHFLQEMSPISCLIYPLTPLRG